MGITNAAKEGTYQNAINMYYLLKETSVVVNTGNKSGTGIFNNTYTLNAKEQDGRLLNYYDAVCVKGSSLLGMGLEDNNNTEYYIYGHPNKFYYDYLQEKNNCGVVAALNILALAGVKDISQLTMNDIIKNENILAEMKQAQELGIFYTGPQLITKYNTELAFTLWAIQNSKNDLEYYYNYHDFGEQENLTNKALGYYDSKEMDYIDSSFCLHTYDYTYYKNTGNIDFYDGGTYIWHQKNILNYYGVESDVEVAKIYYAIKNGEIKKPSTIILDEGATVIEISQKDNDDYLFVEGTGVTNPYTGETSEPPTHFEIRIDLSMKEVLNQNFCWVKDSTDAIIRFDQDTVLILQGYYDKNDPKTYDISFLKDGAEGRDSAMSLKEFEDLCEAKNKTVDKESNRYKFEYVYELEDYFYEGRGVILGGDAGFLAGNTTAGGHAIAVVGVVTSGDDIAGFMIVDSGGWIQSAEDEEAEGLTHESAQFISAEKLYEFITGGYYADKRGEIFEDSYGEGLHFIATKDEIRSWADDLNLIGNNKKNNLIGNHGNNLIQGKGGSDHIEGLAGNDIIYGGDGHDVIYGNSGNDTIYGGAGDDKYVYRASDIYDRKMNLVAHHDVIDVGTGRDELEFNDELIKETTTEEYIEYDLKFDKDSFQYFNKDGDLLITYDVIAEVSTTDLESNYTFRTKETVKGNSILITGYFSKNKYNVLKSIKYGERIITEKGETKYQITENLDFIKEILSKGKIIYTPDLNKPNNMLGTMYGDNISGGNYADTIKSGADSDTVDGGCGSDLIYVGSGNDTIFGSHGNDTIYTESGKTTIIYDVGKYSGSDIINTGKGTDYIILKDDGTLGISKGTMIYSKNKNDLVVTYHKESGSCITIKNYFSKKGKTSVKSIEISSTGELIELIPEYNNILAKATATNNTKDGNNLIKGSGILDGELGFDTIQGGAGNDTIIGGLNNDMMYGNAGVNTYEFNEHASGNDTIYTTSKSETILDFSNTDITFDKRGLTSEYKLSDYAFTKNKNDLVINYATTFEENGNAQVSIANFFNSKDKFSLVDKNAVPIDLQNATIYFDVKSEKSNKLTTSNINDYILCSDKNDTIKSLKGNDTIYSGKGNDNITAGAGNNIIEYTIGSGYDTINLTKSENLTIKINNAFSTNSITYRIEKNNLILSHTNEYNETEDILNIKNFGSKDVTTESGSVLLNINNDYEIDLRNDIFMEAYDDFTIKENKFTGTWLSEKIDASVLNRQLITVNKGANINANNGHDSIIGSEYGDTIKAGNGNDIILTNQTQNTGKNIVDGGNGSDVFKLFYDREIQTNNHGDDIQVTYEITDIKDTGKVASDVDRVYINLYKSELVIPDDVQTVSQSGKFWFNITSTGKVTNTIYLETYDGKNVATLTNIEEIYTKDNYKYNMNLVIDLIKDKLKENNVKDVATLMKSNDYPSLQAEILKIFAQGWEETVGTLIEGTDGDDRIKEYGITGLDTINSYAGNDRIDAGDKIEYVYGGEGDDTLYGKSTEVIQKLYGEAGDDKISASEFGAELYGGEGNDTLMGGNGKDIIEGGVGDDLIYGSGRDSIIFNNGDGNDTYIYTTGIDTIQLKDTNFMDLSMTKDGNDLILESNTDSIRVSYTYSNASIINNLRLIDALGTQYSFKELLNNSQITYNGTNADETITSPSFGNYIINAKEGDDVIESKEGRDTIIGGKGNDTIKGSGNDVIEFYTGDGIDKYEYGKGLTSDTISFKDVALSELKFEKNGKDLLASNGSDMIVISGLYSSSTSIKENLYIADKTGAVLEIADALSNSTIYVESKSVNEWIDLEYYNGNYNIKGNIGHELIYGGLGNNTIEGGKGNDAIHGSGKDLIIFKTGDGKDTYSRRSSATGNDTISVDVLLENLSYTKDNRDLIINVTANDSIELYNFYDIDSKQLYDLEIVDASGIKTTLSEYFKTASVSINGTNGNDTIDGLDNVNSKILGGAGNDVITSLKGADIIYGGTGNDTITGSGNDTIVFEGNYANDTYKYTNNTDTLSFTDVKFEDMSILKDGNDLIISTNGDANSVKIVGAYNGEIKNIDFAVKDSTNTEKTFDELVSACNVQVNGTNGNDTLTAGKDGQYALKGGSGNDTYIIDNINSKVTIEDNYGSNSIVIKNSQKEDCSILLFVDKDGNISTDSRMLLKSATGENIIEANNYNTISKITVKDGYYIGETEINELKADIASWLDGKAESVLEIIESGNETLLNELLGICNNINWQTDTPAV